MDLNNRKIKKKSKNIFDISSFFYEVARAWIGESNSSEDLKTGLAILTETANWRTMAYVITEDWVPWQQQPIVALWCKSLNIEYPDGNS